MQRVRRDPGLVAPAIGRSERFEGARRRGSTNWWCQVFAALAAMGALSLSPAASRAQQSAAEVIAARNHYAAGQTQFEQRRFTEALAEFQTSFSALESPNTLLYIARCERELGHRARAYRTFEQSVSDAELRRSAEPRYDETFRAATVERDALNSQVGFVILRPASLAVISPPILSIDGRMQDGIAWGVPVAIDPGAVDLEVRADGQTARRRMTPVAGGTETWAVEFGASGSSGTASNWTPVRIGALTAGGLGVVSLAAGAIVGAVAQSRFDSLVVACGGGPCPAARQPEVTEGMALVTAANLLVGAGVTLAIGGGLGMLLVPSSPRVAGLRAGVFPTPRGWLFSRNAAF